ncbi:MAG: hypothetical protein E6Y96_20445, partial [Klebsiella pneumoniae]|nr:hypothetical protein [Klebsiella pneumoniae]MDU6004384.1 hypothetical protein [Klebsiella pneumoniae]
RCVCGKKIGPDPRNFNQRVSLGRNDLLIRTFLSRAKYKLIIVGSYELLKAWSNRISRENSKEYDFIPRLTDKLDLSLNERKLSLIISNFITNKGNKNEK